MLERALIDSADLPIETRGGGILQIEVMTQRLENLLDRGILRLDTDGLRGAADLRGGHGRCRHNHERDGYDGSGARHRRG